MESEKQLNLIGMVEHFISRREYDDYIECAWRAKGKEEVIKTQIATMKEDREALPLYCYYTPMGTLVTVYEEESKTPTIIHNVR